MRAHLSAPHGTRAGRDGKRTPRLRSRRFCRSPCEHISSPWLLDLDIEMSMKCVVVVVCGPKLFQAPNILEVAVAVRQSTSAGRT
jgi:hypothetical protein